MQEVRVYLFSDEVTARDSSTEPEEPPEERVPAMAGMGVSVTAKEATAAAVGGGGTGKVMSGFGNAVTESSGLVDSVMDMFGRVLQPTDEKAEVMQACLRQGSTGEYQPVEVFDVAQQQMSHSQIMTTSMTRSEQGRRRRQHVKGRAGGGWESDEDEEEEQLQGEIVKKKQEREKEQLEAALADLSAQQEQQE